MDGARKVGSTKPQPSDKNSGRLPLTLTGAVKGSTDPPVAGESTQVDPAEGRPEGTILT